MTEPTKPADIEQELELLKRFAPVLYEEPKDDTILPMILQIVTGILSLVTLVVLIFK